ncbi:protein phtf [Megachile rotundata]|uniref:protein phtf n=1 Tax=Megachile rotundata TaxID=143995 RepID=UPI000614B10E|nr:PREDICTED: putative homeodomain transcription factor [Megachile rotundata]
MKLNELVYWYQKKIGTYDKQQWEKTVEQHILGGFTHVPMRTAKLKTEFIDVDLVRDEVPRVKIKVFRGPNEEQDGEKFTTWGFWIKQPAKLDSAY